MDLERIEKELRVVAESTAEVVVAAKTEAILRVNILTLQLFLDKGLLTQGDIDRFFAIAEKDADALATIAPKTAKEVKKLAEFLRHTVPQANRRTN